MPLPSLHLTAGSARTWSLARAAFYGGALGALAAIFKSFGRAHEVGAVAANFLEVGSAALGFALLCAVAAALRNLIARRLIRPERE